MRRFEPDADIFKSSASRPTFDSISGSGPSFSVCLSSIRTDSLPIIFVSSCLNSIKDSGKHTVVSMYLKTLAGEFSEYAMNRPQGRRPFGLKRSHMRKPFVQVTNAEKLRVLGRRVRESLKSPNYAYIRDLWLNWTT